MLLSFLCNYDEKTGWTFLAYEASKTGDEVYNQEYKYNFMGSFEIFCQPNEATGIPTYSFNFTDDYLKDNNSPYPAEFTLTYVIDENGQPTLKGICYNQTNTECTFNFLGYGLL